MPGISRVAFTLGNVNVYWYGIIMALSIGLGLMLGVVREQKFGLEKDTTVNLALWMVPMALIGARTYFVIFSWDQYKNNLLSVFDTRSGGMALYGSIIGGALAGLIYAQRHKLSFAKLGDLAAPCIALGQGIGRWGNFFNQEAYGVSVSNPRLQWFPFSVYIEHEASWHLATFFYESVWCLLLCAALLMMEKRHTFRRPGNEFLVYLVTYALERMLVEGLRTDSLMFGSLRVSQILSLAVVIIGVTLLMIRRRKTKER